MTQWHDSFYRMKQRPFVLVVCPQAVQSSWEKVVREMRQMKPWEHQQDAADFARARKSTMLAMDMGTGKTLTALMATDLAYKDGVRFIPLCNGTNKKRVEALKNAKAFSSPMIVCVNYDSVWRGELGKEIAKTKWQAIILDESHRIKSPGGKASRFLYNVAKGTPLAKRLCLTGTPMPHSPLDLYGQFRFLDTEVFGTSFARMRARYAITDATFPSKVLEWKNQKELSEKMDENSWRVTSEEVLDLPSSIREVIPVPMRAKTKRIYAELENEMAADVDAGIITASNALTKLLRLQQVTSGYGTVDGGVPETLSGLPEKVVVLEERIEDLPKSEPIVVFCRFKHDLREVEAMSRRLGRSYSEVSGERKDLERWQNGDTEIIGVQVQSGGSGIDLTRAAYCFYYSLGFSLGDYEQSLARLLRPGQTRMVRYYHLCCEKTVDERVQKALRERKNVVESVLEKLSARTEAA